MNATEKQLRAALQEAGEFLGCFHELEVGRRRGPMADAIRDALALPETPVPVIVIVHGGVADYVEGAGADTRIIDQDNIEAGDLPTVLPRGAGFEPLLEESGMEEGKDYTWDIA